jgi:hypothetical protein
MALGYSPNPPEMVVQGQISQPSGRRAAAGGAVVRQKTAPMKSHSVTGTHKAAGISDRGELLCKLASALAKIIDCKTGPL